VQGIGFTLVDALAARGGALRWAAWLSLNQAEKLLVDGVIGQRKPAQPQQPKEQYGNWHGSERTAPSSAQ
jgi:hypothetical protein